MRSTEDWTQDHHWCIFFIFTIIQPAYITLVRYINVWSIPLTTTRMQAIDFLLSMHLDPYDETSVKPIGMM